MLSNANESTEELGYMCRRIPRGDAGGLSREYVLRIPSVS